MQTIVRCLIVLVCGACWSSGWGAGDPSLSANEAAQLFDGGNFENALPVYEASAAEPTNALYAERLAYCLMVRFGNLPEGAERTATFERAGREQSALRRSATIATSCMSFWNGCSSRSVRRGRRRCRQQRPPSAGVITRPHWRATRISRCAIRAPTRRRLFAGDVYFVMKKLEPAAEWFQKAIEINPNIETAYRYWGDALMQFNQQDAALQKFIDAVVAEPYSPRSWAGLKQWADRTGHELAHPRIKTSGARRPPVQTIPRRKMSRSTSTCDIAKGSGRASERG